MVAGFIAMLGLVPQSGGERLAVFSVAGVLLLIGAAMHVTGRVQHRRKRSHEAPEA